MVRNKTPSNTATPTPVRRSTRNRNVVGTPGERFRSLVSACSDYVPVAEIVVDSTAHVDDVVVSPPPNKRTKPTALPAIAENLDSTAHVDDVVVSPPRNKRTALPAIAENTHDDNSSIPDGDRKLPARRDLHVSDENTHNDDVQDFLNGSSDDSEEYDSYRADYVLDAVSGKFHAQHSSSEEEDDDDDGVLDYNHDKNVGVDDENIVDDGGLDDGNNGGGDDENNVARAAASFDRDDENNVAQAAVPFDPSSLFLHAEEDATALLSFFADDSNFEEQPAEAPVKINNE